MRVRAFELRIIAVALVVCWSVAAALVLLAYRPGGPFDVIVGLTAMTPIAIALTGAIWPPVTRGDVAFPRRRRSRRPRAALSRAVDRGHGHAAPPVRIAHAAALARGDLPVAARAPRDEPVQRAGFRPAAAGRDGPPSPPTAGGDRDRPHRDGGVGTAVRRGRRRQRGRPARHPAGSLSVRPDGRRRAASAVRFTPGRRADGSTPAPHERDRGPPAARLDRPRRVACRRRLPVAGLRGVEPPARTVRGGTDRHGGVDDVAGIALDQDLARCRDGRRGRSPGSRHGPRPATGRPRRTTASRSSKARGRGAAVSRSMARPSAPPFRRSPGSSAMPTSTAGVDSSTTGSSSTGSSARWRAAPMARRAGSSPTHSVGPSMSG